MFMYICIVTKHTSLLIQFHQSNAKLLPTYSNQINSLYEQTSSTHANAVSATLEAKQLLSDVTEAERKSI